MAGYLTGKQIGVQVDSYTKAEIDADLDAFVFDAGNNVGIGIDPSGYNSAMNRLVIHGSGDSGLTVVSGNTSEGSLAFADGTSGSDAYSGWINYNHNSNFMRFFTSGTERARITNAGYVGIGTTNPLLSLVVSNSGAEGIEFNPSSGGTSIIQSYNRSGSAFIPMRPTASQIEFYTGTSPTEKVRIDSNGNLGVGNNNPSFKLDVVSSTDNIGKFSGGANTYLDVTNGTINARIQTSGAVRFGSSTNHVLLFTVNNTEQMRFATTGNASIGTTTTNHKTTIVGSNNATELKVSATDQGSGALVLGDGSSALKNVGLYRSAANDYSTNGNWLNFDTYGDGGFAWNIGNAEFGNKSEVMRIGSNGDVGIGTDAPFAKLHVQDAAPEFRLYSTNTTGGLINFIDQGWQSQIQGSAGQLMFMTGGTTERIRIDTAGSLLVGKTSGGVGISGFQANVGGDTYHTVSNNPTAYFNRLTSDGDIVQFRKDGATSGFIGTANGGDLYVGNDDTALLFAGGSDAIIPRGTNGASRDAAINLGLALHRFKDLYLSGGVYLGGTSSSNLLDDYEEGTWTPEIKRNDGTIAASANIFYATYVKIGRLVFLKCYITSISDGSSNGSQYWRLNGAPFAGTVYTGAWLSYNNLTPDGVYIGDAGGNMIFTDGNVAYSSPLGSNGQFMLGIVYETNA